MAGLTSPIFRNTKIVSFLLAGDHRRWVRDRPATDRATRSFWQAVFRWLHVLFGIMWIGLLYYFNFVQIRKMPEVPAELKPGVTKYIAPEALFWFRWAAVFTVLMGLILAYIRGYLVQALALGFTETPVAVGHSFIGLGMWLGLIIRAPSTSGWPSSGRTQKIALGLTGRRRRRRHGARRAQSDGLLAAQHLPVGADAGLHDDEPDDFQPGSCRIFDREGPP